MNKKFLLVLLIFGNLLDADDFINEARELGQNVKTSLVKQLNEKISQEGPVSAIDFCNTNVKLIAKTAAGEYLQKYEFGRTSHKVRNQGNLPQKFLEPYLSQFQGKFQKDIQKDFIVHTMENNKRTYFEPIYVQPLCLQCHGDSISKEVSQKINQLYPKDAATGFKVGEFRGFFWVKER